MQSIITHANTSTGTKKKKEVGMMLYLSNAPLIKLAVVYNIYEPYSTSDSWCPWLFANCRPTTYTLNLHLDWYVYYTTHMTGPEKFETSSCSWAFHLLLKWEPVLKISLRIFIKANPFLRVGFSCESAGIPSPGSQVYMRIGFSQELRLH